MPRLFFAVRTPHILRNELERVQKELETNIDNLDGGFRHENLNNSHCTLRFLGNIDEAVVSSLVGATKAQLDRMKVSPFQEALTKIGTFTYRGKARVLWIGLSPIDTFQILRDAVDAAVASVGIPVDSEEEFHPHLTLIRFREPFRFPNNFEFPEIKAQPALVSEIELIESKTLPQGAIHTVRASFQL